MKKEKVSSPLSIKQVQVTDGFWKHVMEVIRTKVIPYQWEALNDRIKEAAPSFCMRNFKLAARRKQEKKSDVYPIDCFNRLPKDSDSEDGPFYGFVFQDSDFAKWIEAVAYSLAQHPDEELERTADKAIEIVCAAQREDGYLDTFYLINDQSKIFTNLKDHHEFYCFGHLTEGAIAYYEATGKDKLLNAARKYADYIDSIFGPDKKLGYPGHEIAEMALMRLYDVTKEVRYYNLAKYFIEQRGKQPYYFDMERGETNPEHKLKYHYYQAHLPVREQKEAVGHAVRAVYLYSGMADVARVSMDQSLYDACEQLFDNVMNEKMYITGGIGATHIGEAFSFSYDLPNDTAYAETCASIGLVFFARRMLEIAPKAKYADVMERALYNGILSGMALDGQSFFYVNPLEVLPEACEKDERKQHVKAIRQKWFGCACCPPNLARLISSIGKYAYTYNEDTLFLHLYLGGKINFTVHNENAEFEIISDLPYEGNVQIICHSDIKESYTIAVRIPDWCGSNYWWNIDHDAAGVKYSSKEQDGYLYLTKNWGKDESISITFDMKPRFMLANKKVREDSGKVALMRGPMVYCMEEVDNGTNLPDIEVDVSTEPEIIMSDVMGEQFVKLMVEGRRSSSQNGHAEQEKSLYEVYHTKVYEYKKITMIPYYMWNNRGVGEMQVWTRYYEK